MNNSTLKLDILDITHSLLSLKEKKIRCSFINNNDQTTNIYHLFFEKKDRLLLVSPICRNEKHQTNDFFRKISVNYLKYKMKRNPINLNEKTERKKM